MTRRISWRSAAERDIEDIALFLHESSPAVADRFLVAVVTTLHHLAAMPRTGRTWQFDGAALSGLRSRPIVGFDNYLVFFRPSHIEIQIVRVLHGARDLPGLLSGPESW